MAKNILYHEDARKKLKAGVDAVANAVRITMGPRGRNVVLQKSFGGPTITNDGVSIAKEITLSDAFENLGADIIKEVATKTNDMAGDGTTTSVVLTQALVQEGMRHTTMGVNAMGIKMGIEQATAAMVTALKEIAKPIKNKDEYRQVAVISSESEEIGRIIAETIEKVGKDGVVTVEESQSTGITSEVVEGMEFDKGYLSPYMVTNAERMEAEYKDVPVLITDKKISAVKELLPLLEKLAQTGRKEIVIIAEDIEGEALATFVLNKIRGNFHVLGIKAPGFGDRKKDLLEDIAVTCGAKVISDELGLKLDQADVSLLGRAARVVSTKEKTVIVGGKGKKADIEKRATQIRALLQNTKVVYEREYLEKRLAKLTGGVAIIRVGAATETEMKYMKLKIEDAVNATKAAIEEGIVAGGGSAFLKAAEKVRAEKNARMQHAQSTDARVGGLDAEFEVGYDIVLRAAEAPFRQIVKNAGHDDASAFIEKIKNPKDNAGYNVVTMTLVPDMLKAGIIDPVKVARSGLQHAASAAAVLLTTEVAITDEPKEEKATPDMAGGGMY